MYTDLTVMNGTQPVQQWQEAFVEANGQDVDQAFDHGLADNVIAILNAVHERLDAEWNWT
jgi:hypothetical protein